MVDARRYAGVLAATRTAGVGGAEARPARAAATGAEQEPEELAAEIADLTAASDDAAGDDVAA